MEKIWKFMKNKKYVAIYLVGVLLLSTGVSFAYFTATTKSSGTGGVATATTATVESEGILADGNISVSEENIYPGHKTISSIKVTGTGDNTPLIYNVIFNGNNTFETNINYKVYKTTSNVDASYTCTKEQSVVEGTVRHYETCNGVNIDELGEVIASGTINKGDATTTLVSDEILLTTENGNVVYYYVEIEYPNNDENQNSDMTSILNGSITVEESSNEYISPNILFTASTTAGSNNWYKSVNITTNITTHTGNYEVLYCTTTSSSCTPNTTPTISNNAFNVSLSNNKSSQKICVRVTDEYNQVTEGCSSAYNVDNANPSASVTLASSTSGSNGWYKAASIRATGSDSHSGVSSIQYCTTTSSSCTPSTSSSGSSATVTLNSNASGQRVCTRAIDQAGNTGSTSCSSAYSVDKTNPNVSITSTSATANSITVNVSGSDSHSGIYQYKFSSNNGSSYTTVTSSNGSYSYTFNNLNDDTTYTIAVQVVDRAGNTSSKVTRSVKTDVGGVTMDTILAGKTEGNRGSLGSNYTSSGTGKYFTTTDWDGTTYYFAGDVDDNYVRFAGFYWRIIRINGDGSIRLIYQGTSASGNGLIGTSAFNSSYDQSRYVGLVYGTTSQQHGYGNNSTIMGELNTWYTNNIQNKGYASYIDTGAGFCSDRGPTSSSWTSAGFEYAAYDRIVNDSTASLDCSAEDILSKDNGRLDNPIGLITVDEVAYAGLGWSGSNTRFYLHTGQNYWTMSPFYFGSGYAWVFGVNSSGDLNYWSVYGTNGVRPVINLKANTQFTGSGTSSNPYVVVLIPRQFFI